MSAMVVIGAVWLAVAVGLAVLVAGGIHIADAEQSRAVDGMNVPVDGTPLAAPRPAAAAFASAELPGAPPLSPAPRTADGG